MRWKRFRSSRPYRLNQEWLLEVPPPQADPEPPDLAVAERIFEQAAPRGRGTLPLMDAQRLLAAFGIVPAAARGGRHAGRGACRGAQAALSGAHSAALRRTGRCRQRAAASAADARLRGPMAS